MVGSLVQAKVYAAYIELWQHGGLLARHERCFGRQQQVLDLEHYLDVLLKKPGALAGSTPLAQCRAQGRWPASYDQFWAGLKQRQGKQQGTKAMIEVLLLAREYGALALQQAVTAAVAFGGSDVGAVQLLLSAARAAPRSMPEPMEIGFLCRYDRPPPMLSNYDQLLSRESSAAVVQ
jgi:hypothetical protein